ncbi:signal-transducing adaptor protein 1 [Kryptolebias marmoratus]|uniref:Signal-transducing adaptor protein 1-like n=1 Tax=Kryptolebias marmoratus TaxID=37003 RepID=A0A3Q3AAS9_KRYMA|nr:signal-transducing adaptor protein 1 [Kryptolebias marmoratus]
MMAKRTRRTKCQLPECYYEGYLEKRSTDQTSQKLWTCLCGNALFFFNEKRDADYVDKVDLAALISVVDDNSPDCKTDSARFKVQLRSESVKFAASNAESRELWKGFIHAVGLLSVPSSHNLLPGQIHMMLDAAQKEKERLANSSPTTADDPSPLTTTQIDRPACFFEVPWLEAELLLEREASKGNLLVRPGRRADSYAISTRMELAGPVFKHYRVLCNTNGGFYIDVDSPVSGDTLQELVNYLVEKTNGALIPLIIEDQYDKNISFVSSDKESGEKTQQSLPKPICVPTAVPRKHVVEKSVASEAKPVEEKNSPPACQSSSTPARILTPPTPAPRKGSIATPVSNQGNFRKLSPAEEQKKNLSPAISELKLRFGQKVMV